MKDQLVRFLLVEDDEDHAALVLRSLQKSRVANEVDHVDDGAKALAYVRQEDEYSEKSRPDVILLDLKLPKLDGHEVLRQIKEDPRFRDIPIVVLTTSKSESDRHRAYDEYANSYLVKPVDFDQFRTMIDDLNLYWGVWNLPVES